MQQIPVSDRKAVPDAAPAAPRWSQWARLFLCLVVAFILRWYCLACKPFWFDETYSVELSRLDWRNFLHVLWWREANMSLYYLLLKIWLFVGQSPIFIRGLSVVFGVGTVLAIFWLADLLHGHRVALLAAALMTFNAYEVRYSQEARSYALFLLLNTLSSAFFVAWLRTPTRRNRTGYIVASILACYAHFYSLLLIAAQWLSLRWSTPRTLTDDEKSALRRAWIAIGIGALPLLVFIAKTGAGPIKWIQRPGIVDLLNFFEHLAGNTQWVLLLVFICACVAAVWPIRGSLLARTMDWETWRCQFLLVWLLFPVALTVLLSFARPVFLPRYLIFVLPALIILAAAGLARLRNDWVLAGVLVPVLLLAGQGVRYVYGHDFDTERDDAGAATNFIFDHAHPGDGVIFHIANTRVAYEYFRTLRAGENTASPQYAGHLGPDILFPNHGPGLDYRDFTGKPTAEFVRSAAVAHPRMWLMLMNNGLSGKPDPTTDMLLDQLGQTFGNVQVWNFARVDLRLYSAH